MIEDDAELSAFLREKLTHAGFRVMLADSVMKGLIAAREVCPAVVVANVDLPHGQDIVARVRGMGIPLVLMTRADAGGRSLSPGVEVIRKPFVVHALLERLDVLRKVAAGTPLQVGAVRLNASAREVKVSGTKVEVSPMEGEFLRILMRSPHRAHSGRDLTRAIWPGREMHPNSLSVLVMKLRRKLSGVGIPEFIRTVRGYGYGLRT